MNPGKLRNERLKRNIELFAPSIEPKEISKCSIDESAYVSVSFTTKEDFFIFYLTKVLVKFLF